MPAAMSKNKEVGKTNMIKTLRITSIAAAVLAGILFVFPVVFGVRSDGQIEQFLNSAGVIAKFREAAGNKAKESESEVSPLVKQAEAFALYLNPPVRPKPVAQAPTVTPVVRPPAPVSAKFTLVGTSFYQSRPEQSLAFIDEPGKGLHWVRQSGEVGRLVIEQIKDGVVVVRDGQRTFEIVAEQRPTGISLLEGSASGATGGTSTSPALGEPTASVVSTYIPPIEVSTPEEIAPAVSTDEQVALEKLVEQLASLQKSSRSDKTGSGDSSEEGAAAVIEKLMEDSKATRVSAEEANNLNGLGKELESVQRDPNLPPPTPSPKSSRPVTRVRRPIRPPPPNR